MTGAGVRVLGSVGGEMTAGVLSVTCNLSIAACTCATVPVSVVLVVPAVEVKCEGVVGLEGTDRGTYGQAESTYTHTHTHTHAYIVYIYMYTHATLYMNNMHNTHTHTHTHTHTYNVRTIHIQIQ